MWTAKIEKKMREKYFISRSQFHKMEAPSLKGARLNTVVKSDVSGASKTLLMIHHGVKDVVKLGLREQESLLAVDILTGDRVPVMTHSEKGEFLPDYHPKTPDDIVVGGEDGEEKIAMAIGDLQKDGCDKVFATELIR